MDHQPGEFQERISIERAISSPDGAGGQTIIWRARYPGGIWAKVVSVRGREEERLNRLVTIETYLIIVRFSIDITTHDRIIWRGKAFNVRSVADREGDRRYLTCECESGVTT